MKNITFYLKLNILKNFIDEKVIFKKKKKKIKSLLLYDTNGKVALLATRPRLD